MHSAGRAHDEHTPARMVITAAGGYRRLADLLGISRETPYKWTRPPERGGTGGRIPTPQLIPVWRLIRRHNWPITAEQLLGVD